ncbi:MAG: GTP-binding protein [Bacteroidota bacterium]|nr:GTP-binding protein [Bacteroidota bacterium]
MKTVDTLEIEPQRGLLRFTTAGSVDDGKSTLIGRLLYDSKSIFEDQMDQLEESCRRRGKDEIDLSLLTDGLRAEREQGITIDVAYRYYATPRRKFIIADTPGHIQYTRNMVTGASTANVALILVDARNGVLEQTVRHTYIAWLLNIKHIVFCVNKMDLVDYDKSTFNNIRQELDTLVLKLGVEDAHFIPISAKMGDNVVDPSEKMFWYDGPTLLSLLETIEIEKDWEFTSKRFPVQYVIRPQNDAFHDYRGYAGRISGGVFHKGDEVLVLPSQLKSRIKTIDQYKTSLPEAGFGESVNITLEDDIDISRGDMIVCSENPPLIGQEITMMVCWFNERPLQPRNKYIIRHTSSEAKCVIRQIEYKVNINTLEQENDCQQLKMNDIACISIKTTKPLFFDEYRKNTITGSVILIDEATNETVAAGMII